MRVSKFGAKTSAVIFSVTVVIATSLASLPLNSARAAMDLRRLTFYPVPLGDVAAIATDSPTQRNAGSSPSRIRAIDAALVARYQQDIASISEAEGAYSDTLISPLVELGLVYQQGDQHEQALAQLDRAAQISRINAGLYAADQVTLTEYMIESLLALGRFEEVEDRYRFLVDINETAHGAAVPQQAASLLKLGQWKLESLHRELAKPDSGQMRAAVLPAGPLVTASAVNTRFNELTEAQTLFVDGISQLIENESWTDPTLFELEQDLVRTFYIDAKRDEVIANPDSYAISDESAREQMRRNASTLKSPQQYQQGVAAYRRMIGYLKKNPDATTESIADVMLGLADWHLLFGKQSEAQHQYEQLQKFLQLTLTPDEEVREILQPELPVSLPAFVDSPISAKPLLDDTQFKGYVDFAFDVKRHGRVANLEVLGSSEGTDSSITDKLASMVRQARFRPALGDAPATAAVRYYYAY